MHVQQVHLDLLGTNSEKTKAQRNGGGHQGVEPVRHPEDVSSQQTAVPGAEGFDLSSIARLLKQQTTHLPSPRSPAES
ncbi:MAG: hypothetical protein CMJ39_08435 [Phycisphaerae bacterium]|nr:hypothetical protein [Phycisphaerae bacterium]